MLLHSTAPAQLLNVCSVEFLLATLCVRGLWRDRLTEIIETWFEHNLEKGWAAIGSHAMFIEYRERSRTSTDSRFGEGQLRDVVEAMYPALAMKLDALVAEGVIREVGRMIYLPKHIIGKADVYTQKSAGTKTREIKDEDFDELSVGIGAMLTDTVEQIPGMQITCQPQQA